MAYYDTPRTPAPRASLGFVGTVARVRDWNDGRKSRRALEKLSDHELHDIGLIRGNVDVITRR